MTGCGNSGSIAEAFGSRFRLGPAWGRGDMRLPTLALPAVVPLRYVSLGSQKQGCKIERARCCNCTRADSHEALGLGRSYRILGLGSCARNVQGG